MPNTITNERLKQIAKGDAATTMSEVMIIARELRSLRNNVAVKGAQTPNDKRAFLSDGREITVGMGATHCMWSDQNPYTVVEIVNAKTIKLQGDKATLTSGDIHVNTQVYAYEANPTSQVITVTLRKNGRWVLQGDNAKGMTFSVGVRRKYHDPSF